MSFPPRGHGAIGAQALGLSLAFQAQFPTHAHPRDERIRAANASERSCRFPAASRRTKLSRRLTPAGPRPHGHGSVHARSRAASGSERSWAACSPKGCNLLVFDGTSLLDGAHLRCVGVKFDLSKSALVLGDVLV